MKKNKHIYVYMYIDINHFAIQKKLTQHCKSIYVNKIFLV